MLREKEMRAEKLIGLITLSLSVMRAGRCTVTCFSLAFISIKVYGTNIQS